MSYLLIIKTGRTMPELQNQCGDFEDWMVKALDIDRDLTSPMVSTSVKTIDVSRGGELPDYTDLSGIIITGSHAMVTERHPWSETTAAWLRIAADKQIPTLGICYGHQLLAYALGGTVDYIPDGREVGTIPVQIYPEAQNDALLHDFPDQIEVQLSHRQAVITLPPDVIWLASSDRVPHQAFRYGECVWGMQFHPEFTPGVMEAYVHYAREGLRSEGFDPEAIACNIADTPSGFKIMQRFASLVF